MKTKLFILITFLSFQLFFGQTLLDKFDQRDGVTAIVVSKKMFQMMASVKIDANDKETQQYLQLMRKLDNMKVFTTTNAKIVAEMKATADTYNKATGLVEMIQVNESDKNLKIWVKSGAIEGQIKELLLLGKGVSAANETILMSLTGDFLLSEIAILTDKMKLPGGNILKNVGK